jgi:predicted flap endonuclease-1-like 5' DNA nuclease
LTDADMERLGLHLQDGGAALVVMADEHEVEPTKAELARLGGRVEDYLVPEETMEQVEESTDVEPVAEEEVPAITVASGRVGTVQGIGPARAAALAAVGITTKQALLERGATPAGRAEIAEQSKISEKLIAGWVSAVDLSRVRGIGAQMGELLQAAGVTTVGDLAQQEAASLHEQLLAVNATKKLVRQVPGVSQIENWIGQAKELPQAVTA